MESQLSPTFAQAPEGASSSEMTPEEACKSKLAFLSQLLAPYGLQELHLATATNNYNKRRMYASLGTVDGAAAAVRDLNGRPFPELTAPSLMVAFAGTSYLLRLLRGTPPPAPLSSSSSAPSVTLELSAPPRPLSHPVRLHRTGAQAPTQSARS